MSPNPTESSLSSIALTGGLPIKHQDLAASIVFSLLYAIVIPPLLYRAFAKSSRSALLIRPIVFSILQVGAFVTRAIISKGHYNTTLFIVAQVLLLTGFILIAEPVVAIFQQIVNLRSRELPDNHAARLITIARLMRIVLIIALGLGVWAATNIKLDEDQSTRNKIKHLREANAALVIGALGACLIGTVLLMAKGLCPPKQAYPIVYCSILLILVGGYKLVTAIHSTDPLSGGTKAAFYLLLALPQWLAILPYFVLNCKTLYFPPSYEEARAKDGATLEMGPRRDDRNVTY